MNTYNLTKNTTSVYYIVHLLQTEFVQPTFVPLHLHLLQPSPARNTSWSAYVLPLYLQPIIQKISQHRNSYARKEPYTTGPLFKVTLSFCSYGRFAIYTGIVILFTNIVLYQQRQSVNVLIYIRYEFHICVNNIQQMHILIIHKIDVKLPPCV